MNRHYLLLLAIVVLGGALRLMAIEQQPLWGDEGLTLLIAQRSVIDLFLAPNDPTPGLYYLLHKILVGPDAGLLAARSISLITGTATIVATFGCARTSHIPSAFSATLTALSFSLIDYSVEARAYSLLVLLVVLSAWAFVCWTRGRSRLALLCFVAFLTLSLYTHFVSVFWIAPMIIAAFHSAWRDPAAKQQLEWALCLAVVMAIPEGSRLAHYPPQAFSWLGQPTPVDALNVTGYVLLPFGFLENDRWYLGRVLTAGAVLTAYALLAWRAFANRIELANWARDNVGGATTIFVFLSLPATIWLFGFVVKPIFLPRTILFSAPGFFMALCCVLRHDHRHTLWVVVGVYAFNLILTGTTRPKENWQVVARHLEANIGRGDVVILCPSWKVMAFRHAMRKGVDAPLLIVRENGTMLIEQKLGSNRRWARAYSESLRSDRGMADAQIALQHPKKIWRINSGCPR